MNRRFWRDMKLELPPILEYGSASTDARWDVQLNWMNTSFLWLFLRSLLQYSHSYHTIYEAADTDMILISGYVKIFKILNLILPRYVI
jgi:hypothetical protein